MKVQERFLKYTAIHTRSDENSDTTPSTKGQLDLAEDLVREMKEIGIGDAFVDAFGYVYGTIPANNGSTFPVIGLIAHMDTCPDMSGENVRPRVIDQYDGMDIVLNEEKKIIMKTSDFPSLLKYKGQSLIVTDGTTLLGADDKAGIAEILTAAEDLIQSGTLHGTVRIAFTPDEEVGRGADRFDVQNFGADYAYTIDGEELGEIEYENFNAAGARVTVHGVNIHPGSAKGRMKNAILIAMEFQAMLPAFENPAFTEKYEGFAHLEEMSGEVETASMKYIIRDHDLALFEKRKSRFQANAVFLNEKYGENTIELDIKDQYFNMKEKIILHMQIIEAAKNAAVQAGVEPRVIPIRGGTDGARLSFMGLPCPNLCTGGSNFHGKYEFIPIQSMEAVVEIIKNLIIR